MSLDLYLTTRCDHLVFRELTVLDADAKTIRLEMPIAADDTVKVYASENILPSSMYTLAEESVGDKMVKKIVRLNSKWKSPTDYFEISYNTLPEYCTKCSGGTSFIDDISYDVRGDLLIARNEKLLLQNIEKFTVTKLNSNSFHPFVGTGLIDLIGSRITNSNFLISQITTEESRTLQKFQELQAQYKLTGRDMTDGETLGTVDNIQVTQDENNPSIFRMDVTVTAQSGKSVEYTQYLKVYN